MRELIINYLQKQKRKRIKTRKIEEFLRNYLPIFNIHNSKQKRSINILKIKLRKLKIVWGRAMTVYDVVNFLPIFFIEMNNFYYKGKNINNKN